MREIEYKFNEQFLNIINSLIVEKNLNSKYIEFNSQIKYKLETIYNVIVELSNNYCGSIKLPESLDSYLRNNNSYSYRLTKAKLRQLIKNEIYKNSNNSDFLNTYVVIGHDIPVNIKQLTVCVN